MFDLFFGLLIVLNAVVMAAGCQYDGLDLGYDLKYAGYDTGSGALYPNAKTILSGNPEE